MSKNEREKITAEEADHVIDGWFAEIYANLPPHHRALPPHERDGIVIEALDRRMREALKKGGRDKDVVIIHVAAKDIARVVQAREPQGLYDPNALILLDENCAVKMPFMTRERMQQWRDHMVKNPEAGCNAGNIVYADTRLALWGDEKTLGELEDNYA
jgi:hypothetical protein